MIRVDINYGDIPGWAYSCTDAFTSYICCKLKEAGVPILGGPILPRVDFSKGTLTTWEDIEKNIKVFVWESC